ncbi:MAG: hypothetical protein JKY87_07475 [Mariprofundus sp.]|nr:hypothetical protein [Mariprofundus sp.]
MSSKWTPRIIVGLTLAGLLYWLFPNEINPRPELWNIQVESGQLSILGLRLNTSPLKQANATFKSMPDTALFTTRQRPDKPVPAMHLEAYFEDLYDAGDSIILTLDADYELLNVIKNQAYQPKLFPNDTIRVGIKGDLRAAIQQLPIRSITIVAGEQVDIKAFEARFGQPSQLIDDGEGNAHVLYPKLGLDFIQPAEGRHVLQFVPPAQFDSELLAPLLNKRKLQPKPDA